MTEVEALKEKIVELHRQLDVRNEATKVWIQSDTQCRTYANQLEREVDYWKKQARQAQSRLDSILGPP